MFVLQNSGSSLKASRIALRRSNFSLPHRKRANGLSGGSFGTFVLRNEGIFGLLSRVGKQQWRPESFKRPSKREELLDHQGSHITLAPDMSSRT